MKTQNLFGIVLLIFATTAANAQTMLPVPPAVAPMSHEYAGKLILSVMIPSSHKVDELKQKNPAATDAQIDQVMQQSGLTANFEKAQVAFQQAYNDAFYDVQHVKDSVAAGPDHDKAVETALEKARLLHGIDILHLEQSLLVWGIIYPYNAITSDDAYNAVKLLAKTDMLLTRFPSKTWMEIQGYNATLRDHVLKLLAKMPIPGSAAAEIAKVETEKRDAEIAKAPAPATVAIVKSAPGKTDVK